MSGWTGILRVLDGGDPLIAEEDHDVDRATSPAEGAADAPFGAARAGRADA